MNAILKYLELVALILVIPFLVQNCTVYKSTNTSLNDAVKSELKVKITKTNGEKEKFIKIVLTDKQQFFGKKNNATYNLINTSEIEKVQLKDKTWSTVLTILSPIIIIGILLIDEINTTGGVSIGY